jgi:2-polyprenyl-3-methyl-5-hydroxy-6-metoxy-1,4-benzoquinol methylase
MAYFIKRWFNPYNSKSVNSKFRERRFQLFISSLNKIRAGKPIRILDIGGTQAFWERMNFVNEPDVHITLLNIHVEPVRYANFSSLKGDACNLSNFKDKEFDIVFSNSVIEHLFTYENQKKMAAEVRRVGRYYYIQTPNYYFPIEPHWLFPFFQFFPYSLKLFLTRNVTIGRHEKNKDKAASLVKEVRLLNPKEMHELFTDGRAYNEKFLGMTKSITMYNLV